MHTSKPTNAITDFLTEDNWRTVQRQFLELADTDHYEDAEFSKETGITLLWGKYDYNVEIRYQGRDYEMLLKAVSQFNQNCIGKYIAYGEEEDKYNAIYIMDMQQLSQHPQYRGELEYFESPAHTAAKELIDKHFPASQP